MQNPYRPGAARPGSIFTSFTFKEATFMAHVPQIRIPATYMRGGTSKGVFFRLDDLPEAAQVPGEARDRLLMRVIGSPDPYQKQIDGMGGATSSTSKTVILSKSESPDHDVDYLFGQVAIDRAFVDWSGNCGNLSAAVGPFAVANGLVDPARIPENGVVEVRIWQVNIGKTIVCQVPITNGEVQETGDFELDGVTFPAAEVPVAFKDPADGEGAIFPTGNLVVEVEVPGVGTLKATLINAGIPTVFFKIGKTIVCQVPITNGEVQETGDFELDGVTFPAAEVPVAFKDPADGEGAIFPTGNLVDELEVPGVGTLKATLINAGIPTVFVNAAELGYTGTELQEAINGDAEALARFETIRAHGAVKMGLIEDVAEAASRQHTPKVAFVAPPASYTSSSGKEVKAESIDLLVRALSMGKLHHAMMGTAAVAIASAAAIEGTLVNLAAGGGKRNAVTFGHPSGSLRVGAEASLMEGRWAIDEAVMSRSARVLMEGFVRIPGDSF